MLVETTMITRALPKMPTMAIIVKATGTITVVRWFSDGSFSYKKETKIGSSINSNDIVNLSK